MFLYEARCELCAHSARKAKKIKPLVKERAEVPAQVKRCVAKVAPKHGGDTSAAFAICVAAGQKNKTLKKGSISSTKKGKKIDRNKKRHVGHEDAMTGYEDLLAANRKTTDESLLPRSSILTEIRELLQLVGVDKPSHRR